MVVTLVVVVVLAVALAVAVMLAVRAVSVVLLAYRRTRERISAQMAETLIEIRACALPPGLHREVARMRRRLRSSAQATTGLLSAQQPGPGRDDLPALARRLDSAAGRLDAELAALQREPDRARVAAAVSSLRQPVEDVCEAGAALRESYRPSALAGLAGGPKELADTVGDEVGAVLAGLDYLRSQRERAGRGPGYSDGSQITSGMSRSVFRW